MKLKSKVVTNCWAPMVRFAARGAVAKSGAPGTVLKTVHEGLNQKLAREVKIKSCQKMLGPYGTLRRPGYSRQNGP